MLEARLAPVRPHIAAPQTHAPILLEDYVAMRMDSGHPFTLNLVGPPGSGRRTAICHLAATPLPYRPLLRVGDRVIGSNERLDDRFTVQVHHHPPEGNSIGLLPWTLDDLIEYVVATKRELGGELIRRCQSFDVIAATEGNPRLCRRVIDELAIGASHETIADCIRAMIRRDLGGQDQRFEAAARYCLYETQRELDGLPLDVVPLLRHRQVQCAMASWYATELLRTRGTKWHLSRAALSYYSFLNEFVALAKRDPELIDRLHDQMHVENSAFAASVLLACDRDWRPERHRVEVLAGSCLPGVRWSEIELTDVLADHADFTAGQWQCAKLRNTRFRGAQLEDSDFSNSFAQGCTFHRASLQRSSFCYARLEDCRLRKADLTQADLSWVTAEQVSFASACLIDAMLNDAYLEKCDFDHSELTGASFLGANVTACRFHQVDLRNTVMDRASWRYCAFGHCNFEFVVINQANFEDADFSGAHLTGSRMRGADLRGADFTKAGLADIDWEGANLRGANFRYCAFHMGSSRSGLVGSPYPGHGSKTGFYTDDFDEIWHRPPEEIRKANLCGADLRGADLRGTDFYLVDLRGALYDEHQRQHFIRCDAILDDRRP